MSLTAVVEECYAIKLKNISHKKTTSKWIHNEVNSWVILAVKPRTRTYFDPEFKCEPEQVRLFTLALQFRVSYQQNKLLFIIDAFYNHPNISKELKTGDITYLSQFDRMSRKRTLSELPINEFDSLSKVKRRFNALFKSTMKDFSL